MHDILSFSKVLSVIFFVAIFSSLTSSAYATTCGDIEYRIYGNCTDGVCSDVFFIDSKFGYGRCSRVAVVSAGKLVHEKILEHEVKRNKESGTGTYELKLKRDWEFPEYSLRELRDYITYYTYSEFTPKRSTTAELRKIRAGSFKALKSRWAAKGINEKRNLYRDLFRDSLVFLVVLVPLFISVNYFICWFVNPDRWRDIRISVILQMSVIGLGLALVGGSNIGFIGAICITITSMLLVVQLFSVSVFLVIRRIRSSN